MPLLENCVVEYRIDELDKAMNDAWRSCEDPTSSEDYKQLVEVYTAARMRRPNYKGDSNSWPFLGTVFYVPHDAVPDYVAAEEKVKTAV